MDLLIAVVVVVAVAVGYFLPSIIAGRRDHPQQWAIVLVNAFLGWTLIGWLIALCWSLQRPPRAAAGA